MLEELKLHHVTTNSQARLSFRFLTDLASGAMPTTSRILRDFIDKHPSLKMLALSFLIVVGTVLIAEAFDVHVPKGYVYFAMAFSLAVEAVNIRMRGARSRKLGQEPVHLRKDLPD